MRVVKAHGPMALLGTLVPSYDHPHQGIMVIVIDINNFILIYFNVICIL